MLLLGEPGTGRTTAARALHDLGPTAGLDFYRVKAARFTPSSNPPRQGLALLRGIEQLSPGGQSFWATYVSGMNEGKPLRIIGSSALSQSDWRGRRDSSPALTDPLLRFCVELPPLRERKGDIPALALAILGRISARLGRDRLHLSDDAAALLAERDWPGNLTQLKLVLEKAVGFAGRRALTTDDLGPLLDEGDESLGGVRRERGEQTRDELILAEVLEYLASGMNEAQILADFPDLTSEDIRACLEFAADRERRFVSVPRE